MSEGFGRFRYQENIQYCRQAGGSLFEWKEHMFCSLDELLKIITGYIAYLKQAKTTQ